MTADWRPVAALAELPAGGRKRVRLDGHSLLLFNLAGAVHAIADSCPHAGAWLGSGKLDGCWLRCPAHGMSFDVRTGCMRGNAGLTLRVYPVRLEGETVWVDLAPVQESPEPGAAPGISVNES
jgi:3-phenylpropionate/trans-cinnamate dioxygenase ferredoxin component